MNSANNEKRTVSRRDALKALAAATGVVALSTVPEKWETPIIETGAIPAHAQASVTAPTTTLTVSNLSRTSTGINDCTTSAGTGSSFDVSFNYNDTTGNVSTSGSVVLYSATISGAPSELPLSNTFVTVSGDAFSGTVTIPFCTRFGTQSSISDFVRLRNDVGVVSNQITITTTRPPGALEADGPGAQSLG